MFWTELLNTVPPAREGIEHATTSSLARNPSMYLSGDRSLSIARKEIVKANIIRPNTFSFSAPTFCGGNLLVGALFMTSIS
ncbi:hypothetical protein PsorP6_014336 [Peronosclerospora sorghi]|uniref:Uncharacterized protein n=1 Tax=Peronosclerospora sorghi TaxID=230839 RepID=A0ACC0VGC5_9STRA|nr:hypothetical protein PsorP6_014336 [Peronosclerospora sorghi]